MSAFHRYGRKHPADMVKVFGCRPALRERSVREANRVRVPAAALFRLSYATNRFFIETRCWRKG